MHKAVLVVGVILSMSGAAFAQSLDTQRPVPPQAAQSWTPTAPTSEQTKSVDPWQAFAPVTPGIKAGAFTFSPAVTAAAFYDDNVFATHSSRQGSWGGLVRPELGIATAGSNYSVAPRAMSRSAVSPGSPARTNSMPPPASRPS